MKSSKETLQWTFPSSNWKDGLFSGAVFRCCCWVDAEESTAFLFLFLRERGYRQPFLEPFMELFSLLDKFFAELFLQEGSPFLFFVFFVLILVAVLVTIVIARVFII